MKLVGFKMSIMTKFGRRDEPTLILKVKKEPTYI